MPKDEEQSVRLLATWPEQYYNSLLPNSYNAVFESPACTIGRYKRQEGDTKAVSLIYLMLDDFISFLNVGKTMDPRQVTQTANLILEDYCYLKIDDFKLFFSRAKKGVYGTSYDRIDGQMILQWLAKYTNERCNEADNLSYSEHSAIKSDERRTMSILELEMYGRLKNASR
jgi:hypothetical protein